MEEPTYNEIELIKEFVCDGCKGMFYMHESGCYERCETFQDELNKYLEIMCLTSWPGESRND